MFLLMSISHSGLSDIISGQPKLGFPLILRITRHREEKPSKSTASDWKSKLLWVGMTIHHSLRKPNEVVGNPNNMQDNHYSLG